MWLCRCENSILIPAFFTFLGLKAYNVAYNNAFAFVFLFFRWPFEELACSSSERLKQMLDNTRYMLRSTAFAVDRYDFVINYKYFKSLHQKTDLLPASGDHQKLTETFKAYLRKTDNDLARSLAVSPFAPREEALRLARRLSDSVHAKVKGKKEFAGL